MKTKKRNSTFYNLIEKLRNLRVLSLLMFAYLFVFYQGSARATGDPISIYAPSFDAATISSFQLNGNAARSVEDYLQLTENYGGESGSAFWKSRIYLGTDKSFSAYFTFLINGSDEAGADGLAFVIQTNTVDAGSMGGGIGYEGISPSIAVEFDTYDNGENGGDNHIAIVEDGCPYCEHTDYAVPSFTLDGGTIGHVWVDYNGTTGLFEVRLSETTTRPDSPFVSDYKDLATKFADNNVFVGFTAATGGSYSNHYILDLLFENSFNPSGIDPSGTYEQAPSYPITYHVTYDGANTLPGASVEVNGETLTTDESGNASISLADGIYPYTVSKTGSTPVTGTTTVSGAAKTENITLEASSAIIYCAASTNDPQYMGIQEVVFNTIDNITGTSNQGYNDFSSISTNVVKGESYILSVYGWGYNQFFKVWFDWNSDGDFADAGEEFSIGGYGYSSSASIDIPSDVATGNVRMRVRSEYQSTSLPQACGAVQYGECEDYTVLVIDAGSIIWDGSEGTDWNTAGNWNTNTVPTASDHAVIPNVAHDPVVNQPPGTPATCNNLAIVSGAVVTIASGKALTVNGVLANNNGNSGLVIESGGSLIQNSGGVAATVKRVISDASDDKWHLFTSPVTSPIQASASSCFAGAYLDSYNELTGEWARLLTNEYVAADKAYSINYLAGSRTLSFPGTLSSSPVVYTDLSYTSSAPGYGAGWHLVGNPYTCGINTDLLTAPESMNNAAYVWNGLAGNYSTLTFGAASATPGTIASLQGFFVRTLDGTNLLYLDNAAKVHDGTFVKSSQVIPDMLKLQITGNTYSDETFVRFLETATTGFDQKYDAYKLTGLDEAPQLYSILTGEKAAINTLTSYMAIQYVPIGLKVGAATTYTINVEGINSFDPSIPISIEDLKLGTSQDLRLNPKYSFTASPGDDENRFRLSFATVTGFNNPDTKGNNVYAVKGIIHIASEGTNNGKIYVYSTTGQLLATSTLSSGETTLR
ncbi:MAG: GEVED domain-containing protein, partial [Bacteroidota bacterium]